MNIKYYWKYHKAIDAYSVTFSNEIITLGRINIYKSYSVDNKIIINFEDLTLDNNLIQDLIVLFKLTNNIISWSDKLFAFYGSIEECKLMIEKFVQKSITLLPFI